MRKVLLVTVALLLLSSSAVLAETKIVVGTIVKIAIAADNTAVVTLKPTSSDENIDITILDELTVDKLKSKTMQDGDEIRCKYEKETTRNRSRIFKKTAGC